MDAARPAAERGFLGHPSGLAVLSGTEGFIGYAYYGMQSILVLFLAQRMLLPEHAAGVVGLPTLGRLLGWSNPAAVQAHASSLAGLFGAFAFAAPLAGGVVADRLLGRTRAIVAGLLCLSAGLAILAFEPLFLFGLLLVLVGFGLSATLKAQLGAMYAADDARRADGFQIYSFSVQVAVLVAPIVCGGLAAAVSWPAGFLAAAAGMVFGLGVYLLGRRRLPPDPERARPGAGPAGVAAPRLSRRDGITLLLLALLLPVLALTAIGNQELYNGYLLWAQQHYDLRWGGHSLPVSWLMSVDGFVSMVTTVLSVAFWSLLEKRGYPVSELPKIAGGAALCCVALLWLAAAGNGRVGLGWGLMFHILNDIGFTNTYAVSLALYSRLGPPALGATVVNACVFQIFIANLLVSRLAGLLATMTPAHFWLLHAGLVGAAALVLACAALGERMVRERSRRVAFATP